MNLSATPNYLLKTGKMKTLNADCDRFGSLIREKRKVPLRCAFQIQFHDRLQFFNEKPAPDTFLVSIEHLHFEFLLENFLSG